MAARTLKASAKIELSGTLENTGTAVTESGSTPRHDFLFSSSISFTNGTAAKKVQRAWSSKVRSLSSGNSENIDLFDFGTIDVGGGAGLDALGQSLALTGIKVLYIENIAGSAGDLVVGGEGSAAAWNSLFAGSDTATLTLHPGQNLLTADPTAGGMTVTDTSNHLLKMDASGGDITYTIAIAGI